MLRTWPRRARATRVTGKADTRGLNQWRVEEDDYGDPMIFHQHSGDEAPAYVISRAPDPRLAQCSECMAYLELDGMADAARSEWRLGASTAPTQGMRSGPLHPGERMSRGPTAG
jgi:hypothetical protein